LLAAYLGLPPSRVFVVVVSGGGLISGGTVVLTLFLLAEDEATAEVELVAAQSFLDACAPACSLGAAVQSVAYVGVEQVVIDSNGQAVPSCAAGTGDVCDAFPHLTATAMGIATAAVVAIVLFSFGVRSHLDRVRTAPLLHSSGEVRERDLPTYEEQKAARDKLLAERARQKGSGSAKHGAELVEAPTSSVHGAELVDAPTSVRDKLLDKRAGQKGSDSAEHGAELVEGPTSV
jgi:hypothetical protein